MHLLLFTRTGAIDKNFFSCIIPGSTSHVCLCLLQNASNIRKKLNSGKTLTNTKEQADTWHSKISSLSFFCILFETQHFSIYFVGYNGHWHALVRHICTSLTDLYLSTTIKKSKISLL